MAYKRVSLAPSDQVHIEGGGSWASKGVLACMKRLLFGQFAYKKKDNTSNPKPALIVTYEYTDAEGKLKSVDEPYSMGTQCFPSVDGVTPASQGPYIISEDIEGLPDSTNLAAFFQKLISAGVPENDLKTKPINFLDGTMAIVKQVPQPEREGLVDRKEGQAKSQKMFVVPIEIKKLGAGGKVTPLTTSAATGSTPAVDDGVDPREVMAAAIGELLGSNGGKMSKLKVTVQLNKILDENPDYAPYKAAALAEFKKDPSGDGYGFDGKEFVAA